MSCKDIHKKKASYHDAMVCELTNDICDGNMDCRTCAFSIIHPINKIEIYAREIKEKVMREAKE